MKFYAAFVKEKEGGGVSVFFPDVPGCFSWGQDMDEAFSMSEEALEGHLEILLDDGDPIPKPSRWGKAMEKAQTFFIDSCEAIPKEIILQLVSISDVLEKPTRVNVSFRKSILTMIDRKAEESGLTRSGFLSRAAEAYQLQEFGRS